MSDLPRISIVTPSFNQGRFLERTIRSVLDQDYPDLEYFIIDGASTDDSVRIIRENARDLTDWVSEPDDGQADAIAKGFRRCTGDILAWINSSDEYEPGAFQRIADEYRNREAALYYGDVRIIGEDGTRIGVECTDHMDLEAMVYQNIFPFQPGSFWTRRAYEECGGVDPGFHYYMDLDLMLRLVRTGGMCYVPSILSNLRKHDDAKTAGFRNGWLEEMGRIRAVHVPPGSLLRGRRMISFAKRLGRFAAQGRWLEVRSIFKRILLTWRPHS